MDKKKVLVVDDSAFMRKLISDFISASPKLEVIGTARNGRDALEKAKSLKPDVITLDVEMPEMTGLEALKEIMRQNPTPCIMLSSTTDEGTENTLTAIQHGAIDFITKPSGTISLDLHKVKDEIVQKVEQASLVQVRKIKRYENEIKDRIVEKSEESIQVNVKVDDKYSSSKWSKAHRKLVCIGTSTGGPRALQEVLTALPERVGAPILVVQHMPAGFTKSLANRLNTLSRIVVKEAEQGEIVKDNIAYIAPGGFHLKIKEIGQNFAVQLDKEEPPRSGHRPSVDVMFESVSQLHSIDKLAVIMTGMGSDGAKGLIKLKETGNVKAIAESKDSCIVYGMPKAAVATNLIDEVKSVEQIAQTIMKYML